MFGEDVLVQPTAVCPESDLTASHEAASEVAEPGGEGRGEGERGGRRERMEKGEEGEWREKGRIGEGKEGGRGGRRERREKGGEKEERDGRKEGEGEDKRGEENEGEEKRKEQATTSPMIVKVLEERVEGENNCFGGRQMMSQTLTSSIRLAGVTSRSFSELCCASPTLSTSAINSPTSCFRRYRSRKNVTG